MQFDFYVLNVRMSKYGMFGNSQYSICSHFLREHLSTSILFKTSVTVLGKKGEGKNRARQITQSFSQADGPIGYDGGSSRGPAHK